MKTWEDTIKYIRTKPEYHNLVEKAYFEADLELNISRFGESEEFAETVRLIKQYQPNAKTILDIGSGNGISVINFAKLGYHVTTVEPDSSSTIGAGAIKILKENNNLENIAIFEDFAENIKFPDHSFDVVYVRQAMHHANDLNKFIKECFRVLKPKGLLMTVRDHVVFNENDKEWFLQMHPLHKLYGGENAYKPSEYKNAMTNSGGVILKEYKHFDNVINYFPETIESLIVLKNKNIQNRKSKLSNKLGAISKLPFVWEFYKLFSGFKPLNELEIPGRMYTYLALKK